ncbi:peptidylprolyl isomerase [Brevundimonas sp.]|uniref:peptidylprolyl isomerase n=1 Tax=Brevundimonas sp. TaxID=1871086 RepID=UPI001DC69B5A|nr:peptidylprolyl isomerase [Brevundimonas sp.]MBA4001034.1 peptidylprolyl isomerase [Brevundimonas sp.]
MRLSIIAAAVLLAATPVMAQDAAPAAAASPPESDWRTVAPENLLVIDTNRGRILVEMSPLAAPGHVERMRLLARNGFYDGLVWHRVIDWFMAQTGDPLGTGDGQSAYPDLTAELTFRRGADMPFTPAADPMGAPVGFLGSLPIQTQPDALMARTGDGMVHAWGVYCPGVAGMARGEAQDSANSQFFLMRQAYPSLDKRYTAWGRVISGLDVVRAIKTGEEPSGTVATPQDVMTSVRVAADIPAAQRPVARVLDTESPTFGDMIERTRAARGADFSICDLEPPVDVIEPAA